MPTLQGLIVTDIHYGADYEKEIGHKMGTWGPTLVDRFVRIANKIKPDFVGNCGDNSIADDNILNSRIYRQYCERLTNQFNRLSVPFGQAQGNHDWAMATHHAGDGGTSPLFPVKPRPLPLEFERARVIFWNANPDVWKTKQSISGVKQKDWLKRALDASDKKTIVMSHAPFDTYRDETELRYIMRDYGNAVLGIHGHKHTPDRLEIIEGVPYFTQQSFTEKQPTRHLPWGAYSRLTVEENDITIERFNLMAGPEDERIFRIRKVGNELMTSVQTPQIIMPN